jgi:hypothetical protein
MLVLGSQRAVYKAIEAFHDGSFRIQVDGKLTLHTDDGCYRVIGGVCFVAEEVSLGADATRMVGAELVGWLHESLRASAVAGFWRRGARALFVTKDGAPLVTPATLRLDVDGAAAEEGVWTHDRRLLVGHGERSAPESPESKRPESKRPASVSPPNAWALGLPVVVPEPVREPLPSFADEVFGGPPRRGRLPSWS